MPELPEVETVKNGLLPHLLDQIIVQVVVRQHKLRWPIPKQLNQMLSNQTILTLERRAKYLILKLKNGYCLIHLGMSGRLRMIYDDTPHKKHDHVDILLKNGAILRYHDPRRFGAILFTKTNPKQHKLIRHLGPEPLDSTFNKTHLISSIAHRKIHIKTAIMNQTIVVGVGNIYASEALFRAKISPLQTADTITNKQAEKLVKCIKTTLKNAIKAGGTTLKDFTDSEGKPGYFQQKLLVYGRQNQACFDCGDLILTKKMAGRSTFYCPSCQH